MPNSHITQADREMFAVMIDNAFNPGTSYAGEIRAGLHDCDETIHRFAANRIATTGALTDRIAGLEAELEGTRREVKILTDALLRKHDRAMQADVREGELIAAYREAVTLATNLYYKHFRAMAPHWEPLPDLIGVITQIDNMTTALVKPKEVADPRIDEARRQAFYWGSSS